MDKLSFANMTSQLSVCFCVVLMTSTCAVLAGRSKRGGRRGSCGGPRRRAGAGATESGDPSLPGSLPDLANVFGRGVA